MLLRSVSRLDPSWPSKIASSHRQLTLRHAQALSTKSSGGGSKGHGGKGDAVPGTESRVPASQVHNNDGTENDNADEGSRHGGAIGGAESVSQKLAQRIVKDKKQKRKDKRGRSRKQHEGGPLQQAEDVQAKTFVAKQDAEMGSRMSRKEREQERWEKIRKRRKELDEGKRLDRELKGAQSFLDVLQSELGSGAANEKVPMHVPDGGSSGVLVSEEDSMASGDAEEVSMDADAHTSPSLVSETTKASTGLSTGSRTSKGPRPRKAKGEVPSLQAVKALLLNPQGDNLDARRTSGVKKEKRDFGPPKTLRSDTCMSYDQTIREATTFDECSSLIPEFWGNMDGQNVTLLLKRLCHFAMQEARNVPNKAAVKKDLKARLTSVRHFDEWLLSAAALLSTALPTTIIVVCSQLCFLNVHPPDALLNLATERLQTFKGTSVLKPEEITNALWAFSRAGVDLAGPLSVAKEVDEYLTPEDVHNLTTGDKVKLLSSLVMLGTHSDAIFDAVMKDVRSFFEDGPSIRKHFSARNINNIAHSLARSGQSDRYPWFLTLACQHMRTVQYDGLSIRDISSFLWSLAHCKYQEFEVVRNFTDKIFHLGVDKIDAQTLNTAIWAMAANRMNEEDQERFLLLIETFMKSLYRSSDHELSEVLWALATAKLTHQNYEKRIKVVTPILTDSGDNPPFATSEELFSYDDDGILLNDEDLTVEDMQERQAMIVEGYLRRLTAEARDRLPDMSNDDMARIAWACGKMKNPILTVDLVQDIGEEAMNRSSTLNIREICDVLWAMGRVVADRLDVAEALANEIIDRPIPLDSVIACNSLILSYARMGFYFPALFHYISDHIVKNDMPLKPRETSSAMWAVKQLDAWDQEALIGHVLLNAEEQISHFDPRSLAVFAWTLSESSFEYKKMWVKIQRRLEDIVARVDGQQMGMLFFSFAKCSQDADAHAAFDVMASQVTRCPEMLDSFDEYNLAQIIRACAYVKYQHTELIDCLSDAFAKRKGLYKHRGIFSKVIWSFAQLQGGSEEFWINMGRATVNEIDTYYPQYGVLIALGFAKISQARPAYETQEWFVQAVDAIQLYTENLAVKGRLSEEEFEAMEHAMVALGRPLKVGLLRKRLAAIHAERDGDGVLDMDDLYSDDLEDEEGYYEDVDYANDGNFDQ